MSDKRGDKYYGMALRRKTTLTEVQGKFSATLYEIENSADKLMKIAVDRNDSALLEIANSILFQAVYNQGWLES